VVTIHQYNNLLREKIRKNTFDLKSTANQNSISIIDVASNAIFPKVVFGQVVGAVDFFGSLLAHALLSQFGDKEQRQRLSNQLFSVQKGNIPWPIYTAVSMAKDDDERYRYHWYEFTPEEIRDLETGLAFPSFAFGRTFAQGQSTDFAPEQSFGFQMGIFGSAFTVNLKDIKRMFDAEQGTTLSDDQRILESIESAGNIQFLRDVLSRPTDFNALKLIITKKIIDNLSDSRIGPARIAPAQVNNPFKEYRYASNWLQSRDRITFVDAGIDYNIPLRPLFRPDRKVDLIFVGDASNNAGSNDEIKKALADIERFHKVEYEKDTAMSDATFVVYRPKNQSRGPLIVYMQFFLDQPLIKKSMEDPSLKKFIEQAKLDSFNAQKCLDASYCGTFNFSYSLEDFDQLAAIGEFIIKAHQDKIKQIIEEVVFIEEFEFGGGF
jgi:phospholipase A2